MPVGKSRCVCKQMMCRDWPERVGNWKAGENFKDGTVEIELSFFLNCIATTATNDFVMEPIQNA